ncbi:hypothetical protein ASD8599_03848 [Ascidiaceihabitans donghaensis]|uniref:Uncharacterized protein n=1 Tax=Ascidiaceihabitans donghaensis TaxID=1510460 RepID=A0A2R8BP74_9RHOB|nr:hypothetical protein ASD8599_03848 [Ascidiaceihabitans donghaensis]
MTRSFENLKLKETGAVRPLAGAKCPLERRAI